MACCILNKSRKHGLFLHKQANQNGSLASSHEHSWALRRKRKKKSKKNHCFWIRFLRWIVLSHIQKFICTTLDLWWMMEGVKDKTERTNKDHELIWIFYTWVDFFSHTVNLSSNVGREEPQAVLEVLFNSRWLKGDVKVLRGKGSLELSRPVWKGHANILLETTKQQSSKTLECPQLPWNCSTQIRPKVSQTLEAALKLPVMDYKCWLQFLGKGN